MSVICEVETVTKFKNPPKFNVLALNNEITSFDEVVFILVKAFNMSESVAAEITTRIDREGKAKCNPKPMSKGLAELQLNKVNETKVQLSRIMPFRSAQIMALTFRLEEG
jgi:ATP-dependent Clp protease adapter protein ClpS